MKIKSQKNSSLELLKILSMILIIGHHYVVHGDFEVLTLSNFTLGRFFLQQVSMYGSLSCDVFALITGYFLIDKVETQSNRIKKMVKLILEMYFYSIGIYVILVFGGWYSFSVRDCIKVAFPMLWGNWYIIAYLLFYIFVPYVNIFLKNLKQKQHIKLIVILLMVWSVVPTLTIFHKSWKWSDVDFFLVIYIIGAYIKLYFDLKSIKNSKILVMAIFSIIMIFSSVCFMDGLGIYLKSNKVLSWATYFIPMYSILSVFCAISWFVYFLSFKFSSKKINYISNSVFAVYLIHENDFFRDILWNKISPNVAYVNRPFMHFIVKVILVFLICIVVDKIRIKVMNKFDCKLTNVILSIYFIIKNKLIKVFNFLNLYLKNK